MMKQPHEICALLTRRFAQRCGQWLAGAGADFPYAFVLTPPIEIVAKAHGASVSNWIAACRV